MRARHKDLGIVLGLTHGLRQAFIPAGAVVMQHINAVIGRGEGSSDLSAIVKVLEAMSAARA